VTGRRRGKGARVKEKKQVARCARDDRFDLCLFGNWKVEGMADPFEAQGKLKFGHYTSEECRREN
jgi:hypothetical protein